MEKSKQIKSFFNGIIIILITIIACALVSFIYGRTKIEIVRNVILAALGAGMVLYLHIYARLRQELDYENDLYFGRFLGIYLVCLGVALVLPFIPPAGWPFLPIFVVLSLFSNSIVGMVAGSVCLTMTIITGNMNSYGDFFIYFLSGVAGIILFKGIDETYKVGARIFMSLLVLAVCLCTNYVLLANEVLIFQLFLIPGINIVISLLLIIVILKYFSARIIHKYHVRYLEINDPEFPLLVSLKERSREEYFYAVHTAYFADRIARKLHLDDQATRAAGYYHRIGVLAEENTWEAITSILQPYHFPPRLLSLLEEYTTNKVGLKSKEWAVLLFSEAVIITVSKYIKEHNQNNVDYKQIINAVFEDKIKRNLLAHCAITMDELTDIKKIFMQEKLYYDFLR